MSQRKTHEQFVSEVYDLVGDEYTVTGEYVNTMTKIMMKHNTCGLEYEVTPNSFLRGHRCAKCAGKLKKTTESFKQEVYDLVGEEYSVLGKYVGALTKILVQHNACGFKYNVRPSGFLSGHRCPKCFGTPRKTTESFKHEVHDLVGGEYSVLGEYVNADSKILIRHNVCDFDYEVRPNKLLSGSRCPRCSGLLKKTTEGFRQEVYDLVGDEYTITGEYVNTMTKIMMKHNTCGLEYEVTPNSFLRGHRCAKCAGKLKKTTESFKQEVYDLVGEEYSVLGKYINKNTKILMRHNNCGFEYEVQPNSFLSGRRCPHCKRSKGELAIEKILKDNGIKYTPEFKFSRSRYRYDFAVFKNDCVKDIFSVLSDNDRKTTHADNKPVLLIEFDGIQHFEPVEMFGSEDGLKETQKRDRAKEKLAKKHNIKILRIRYDQYDLDSSTGLKNLESHILQSLSAL